MNLYQSGRNPLMADKNDKEFELDRSGWDKRGGKPSKDIVQPAVDEDDDLEEEDLDESDGELIDRQSAQTVTDEFVDFEVWIATLEAHFGPNFERVLTNLLGSDWNIQIQQKIMSGENFLNVLNEIKNKDEYLDEDVDEDEEHFFRSEAVGEGEILGDPGDRDEAEKGKKYDEEHFQLADLKRKEFEAEDKLKYDSIPEEFEIEQVVRHKTDARDSDEIVLIDKNDFANLSYYASKEKTRHSDDISLKTMLQRDKKQQLSNLRPELIWVAGAAGLFLFYLVFCIVSYMSASFYTPSLLDKFPPQYEFKPSTSLQPRGELIRLSKDKDQVSQPVFFYIFKPVVRRFEISRFLSGQAESYDLGEVSKEEIKVGKSEWFDSLRVVMNYSRNVPSNFGAILNLPLVELYTDGRLKMFGQETFFSSLMPGYTNLVLYDEAGIGIGRAYISKGNWFISLENESSLSAEQRYTLERELLWTLSIIKI